ncbi:MAG: MarR family winged helix-turn-helix transcriptional regulator [Paracoccus hibiscisoli]|uniref:MarR family winged helix-turn-helix transcriptional regulator n=1 Tax=Paracoccus hibiscisoli TaxID=2023261 RepID=UPI0039196E39
MPFHLDTFLPYLLSVAAHRTSARFAALYAAEAGLTNPEWRVLAHLDHSGAASVRDIHTLVHLDKSVVSRAASRLEQAGLVEKQGDTADRRLIVLRLTPEGTALMLRLSGIAERFQAQLVAELGADAPTLARALQRLARGGEP